MTASCASALLPLASSSSMVVLLLSVDSFTCEPDSPFLATIDRPVKRAKNQTSKRVITTVVAQRACVVMIRELSGVIGVICGHGGLFGQAGDQVRRRERVISIGESINFGVCVYGMKIWRG